jgi:hypothetical protein
MKFMHCCGSEIRCFFVPWIWDPGKSESGSGMNIPDNFSESLETVFRVKRYLNSFDADPDPGSEIFLTLDP